MNNNKNNNWDKLDEFYAFLQEMSKKIENTDNARKVNDLLYDNDIEPINIIDENN